MHAAMERVGAASKRSQGDVAVRSPADRRTTQLARGDKATSVHTAKKLQGHFSRIEGVIAEDHAQRAALQPALADARAQEQVTAAALTSKEIELRNALMKLQVAEERCGRLDEDLRLVSAELNVCKQQKEALAGVSEELEAFKAAADSASTPFWRTSRLKKGGLLEPLCRALTGFRSCSAALSSSTPSLMPRDAWCQE
mmetsp:Transcript_19132/g.56328  ORF Transcript_19132/g.56328 Transcript_19132/m.56328 type:complete len:198 (-) Transcript_19132:1101-1694(-)